METTMKQIRRLFLLLCLITAGAQCAWSQSQYFLKSGSTTEGNLTFDLYSYYYSPGGLVHYYQETYAELTGINGTDDIVVIPDTLSNGAIVRYLDGTISNSEVLKLIFKGKISFSAGLASFIDLYPDLSVNGTLDCQHLQYVIFEGNDNDLGALTSPAAMQCPLLHDIYFIGSEAQTFPYGENIDENHQVYTVYPHWSNICTAPAENVTAHIADWNAYSLNNNKNVYRELKKCVPYSETYSVSLKSNGGGEVKVERWNWYDTSLDYTISSEGGEETITLYDDADFYRIYMYYSGNGQPTLLRNGTAVSTTLSFDGIYTYDDREQMLTKSYEVVFPRFNVNLMLTAGACDKGVEVWSGDTQVGSISKMGGTIWETVENAQSLQFRIPNQYLEKIILNGEDVTATLPSTTPDDPAYAGYTFYTLSYLQDLIAVEVRYSDVAPHPYESSEIRFDCLNGTGVLKNTKVWFEDGTYVSDNMGHTGLIWLDMRTISRIEVTMKPDIDDFAYAQRYNTLGTIVNNGDGTYSYTIPSENLTSSIVPLYFPTSDYGSVKTLISSKNDIKLGYYFGELAIYDGGFLPQYAQANTSLLNSDVTIMHKDNAEPGWDVDQTIGIIYVQVSQGTTFRLVEDGVDHTADCVWYGAGQRLTEVSSDYDFYMTPVAGYYYLLKNVTTDSYIVVDNGNGEISSPWQVQQTVHIIGDGSLSLRKGETVVESIGEGEPTTVSWTTNDNLTLAVTLPDGADIAHYEAILIIDGTESELQKVNGAFTTFDMGSIATAHNIVLITRQTGGFVNTDLLTQHIQLTGEQLGTFLIQYLDEDGADYDDAQADNGQPYYTFTSDEKKYIKGLGIYVNVPQGCTFKASFNGEEVTGFTLENSYYVATLGEAFITDGTWVVEFKNADSGGSNEVVAVLTPDRNTPLYLTNSSGEDVLFAFLNTEIGTITKGGDYTIKVRSYNPHSWKTNLRVNGVDRTADLVTNSENANEMLLPLTNITESLNVEAFYTSRRSIVSLYTTEGGTTKIEYTDNETGEADSRTYSNGDYSNDRIVNGTEVIFTFTPDQGYKLSKVFAMSDRWIGEGDDYEVKLQADGSYRFVLSSGDFIDGLASITVHFEKKGGPYDVNNDGNITIGDVTKLVNVILGKE